MAACSQRICTASSIFDWKLVKAESRILKQSCEQRVNINLISRSLQNVLTNFLILCSVMMEKGPLYSNLKYNNFPYEQHSERNRQGEVIVKKLHLLVTSSLEEKILIISFS